MVPLRLRVIDVVRETGDAHSLVLEPVDPSVLVPYRPGQFLTVRVPTDRPGGAARCYSLCSAPGLDEHLAVTVKRTRGGYCSNWICDNVAVGDVLDVLPPAGIFTPASLDADLLLLAGGSGITPMLSILKSVLHAGSGSVTLVYANRDEQSVIFRHVLAELVTEFAPRLEVRHWLESEQGLPSEPGLQALLRPYDDREVYLCGPAPFMAAAQQALRNLTVPDRRVHVERFTSLQGDPFSPEAAVTVTDQAASALAVTLDGATSTLVWPRSSTLLDVLLDAGLRAPFSCREGACSACACIVLEGDVELQNNSVLDEADLAEGLILGCQAIPKSDRVTVSYDT